MRDLKALGLGHIDFNYVEESLKKGYVDLNLYTWAEIQVHPVLYKEYLKRLHETKCRYGTTK